MKKLLIGCGAFLALIFCIVGVLAFWGISTARQFRQKVEASQAKLAAVDQAFPFVSKSGALIEEPRLVDWLGAAEQLTSSSTSLIADLGRTRGRFAVLRFGSTLLAEAPSLFADALRAHNMSSAEFLWIKDEIEAALSSDAAKASPVSQGLAAAMNPAPPGDSSTTSAQARRFTPYGQTSGVRKVIPISEEQSANTLNLLRKHAVAFRAVAARIYNTTLIQMALSARGGGFGPRGRGPGFPGG